MKIVFVIKNMGLGGSCKQLAMTANALSHYGHSVYIYSYNTNKLEQSLSENVVYIPENRIIKHRVLEWILVPLRIRKKIKEISPDLIISWRTQAGAHCILGSLGTNTKCVFSERSDPYMEHSNIHWITTYLANMSDGGVFQTEKAKLYYKKLSRKSIVIPNPVNPLLNLQTFVPYSTRPHKIVFVGRMSLIQKRQDILLKAMKEINNILPDYKLYLYGNGPSEKEIKNLVTEYGLTNSVVFCGSVTNVVEYIKDARLMLLSSDYEGIPNSIIEAFQVGVPVVTTDCSPGGCRVLIDDNYNGNIVPFRDYHALAEKSIELLNDENKASNYINNSKRKLEEFAPSYVFEKWNNYLTNIYNGKK